MTKNEPVLYLDDHRGVYIPRDFAAETKHECVTGVSQKQWDILSNPDHEWYWECWNEVEQNAKLTDPDTGIVYTLYQNGALWLIPEGYDNPEFFEF